MAQPVLVRCKVRDGVFSDEVVVEIRYKDGRAASFTVPRSDLQGNRLRAVLLGKSLVMLPTAYPVTILVDDGALEQARS